MIYFPNAKINIGLNIIKKRQDGYHDIKSLLYPIPLCDALEIRPNQLNRTKFVQTGLPISTDNIEENLVMKAYRLLQNNFKLPFLDIHLHKVIPSQAGLGGGSSDAAFALMLINRVCELGLSQEDLARYALMLGSDCPFFMQNKPMEVSGRGEIMKDAAMDLSGYWLTLIKTQEGISTKEAYDNVVPKDNQISYSSFTSIDNFKDHIFNDFEPYVFAKIPLLSQLKQMLYEKGALYVSLTGSGSCMYALSKMKLDVSSIKGDSDMFLRQTKMTKID
ncbi:MAG: 4-(cytidine 5'-diphospho)-2-C-methyl-D-erythritol kinase [Bacteroidales bacterium]|jgi:4-diphosphocytidyl-2-C-methyl-D-erythritol kinase|nr:4-(cytidine 5'-diphospho)-2-C-methyl-D-erythritol kinase [Bacteroidales bacterium]